MLLWKQILKLQHFVSPINTLQYLEEDSDYMMLNVPYIPFSSLSFEDTKIIAKIYLPSKILKTLNISAQMMGLYATLAGNDFIKANELQKFWDIVL